MRFTTRGLTVVALAGLCLFALAPIASSATVRPVIGTAVGAPGQAVAGQPLAVSARVTRSDNGKALSGGAVTCKALAGTKPVGHTQSLKAGVARCAFVVPATATVLHVTLTVTSGGESASRSFTFVVRQAPKPSLSVSGATVTEGNSGTTTLSFPVTLSKATTKPVSFSYATADGTATQPSDYAAASGTLTIAPGGTSTSISVSVVGDVAIEPDETLTVTLSNPVNATIGAGSATGTIKNDDTQVPISTGSWKGQMSSGDFMYFEVGGDRTMNDFRINDVRENCDLGGYFEGSLAFDPTVKWPVAADGTSGSTATWQGSDQEGDIDFTYEMYNVVAHFNGSSASGTFQLQDHFTYQGYNFSCDTTVLTWTATKQ
jgi:hypothetical protein